MNVNIFLFDDFDMLGAFGPAEIFSLVSGEFGINYWSLQGDIVNSSQGLKVWTEPVDLESSGGILLVPNGRGARRVLYQERSIIEQLLTLVNHSDYCMMVGDGAGILAQTGALYRRNVADSLNENWKRMFTAAINWVSGVPWVADGKYYSSFNALHGIDMALGLIADVLDVDIAMRAAEKLGYHWEVEEGYF